MQQKASYTTIPIQVMTNLRNLSAEEFKVIGALCYLGFNEQKANVSIEQIEAKSGIFANQIKPVLQRLTRRGWLLQEGNLYRLAFRQDSLADRSAQSEFISSESDTQPRHYDPALGVRPPRVVVRALYPEGPWLTKNGLLDADFIQDRAQVWRTGDHYQAKAFGAMAIEDVMGTVCKHYAKPENHGNLEIDWHSYCAKNQRYLANIQQRLQSGAQIQSDEQELALKKLHLAAKPSESTYEQLDVPIFSPNPTNNIASATKIDQPSLPLVNPPPLSPATLSHPATLNPATLSSAMQLAVKSIPAVEPIRPLQMKRIDKLKLWLSDPILRFEAEKEAQKAGYELSYNEYGIPIAIVEPTIDF